MPASTTQVTLTVNGQTHSLTLDTRTTLLDTLREHLGLTGTKVGCNHGTCGACTVHHRRTPAACLPRAGRRRLRPQRHHDRGPGRGRRHAAPDAGGLRRARRAAVRLLHAGSDHVGGRLHRGGPRRTDDDIREYMSGNLCRCGAYPNIVAAVRDVAQQAA